MICNAITRQGYINVMKDTDYGEDIDSPIGCPHHLIPKFGAIVECDIDNCKECWESILEKVKFKEDVL